MEEEKKKIVIPPPPVITVSTEHPEGMVIVGYGDGKTNKPKTTVKK